MPVNVEFLQNLKSTSDSRDRGRLRQMVKLDVDKLLLDPSHGTEGTVYQTRLGVNVTTQHDSGSLSQVKYSFQSRRQITITIETLKFSLCFWLLCVSSMESIASSVIMSAPSLLTFRYLLDHMQFVLVKGRQELNYIVRL